MPNKDAASKAMEKLQRDDGAAQPLSPDEPPVGVEEAEGGDQQPRRVEAEQAEASALVIPEYGTPEKALADYVSEVGLSLPEGLNFTDYELLGRGVRTFYAASMWIVGDYLNYGERNFSDAASQVVDSLGYEYSTLQQAKSVSKSVPRSERNPNLSWSHHQVVAALDSEQRQHWLNRAEVEGWGRDDLRDRIRESQEREPGKKGRPSATKTRSAGTGTNAQRTARKQKAQQRGMTVVQMAAYVEQNFAPHLADVVTSAAKFTEVAVPALEKMQGDEGIDTSTAEELMEPIRVLMTGLEKLYEQAARVAAFEPPVEPESEEEKAVKPKAAKKVKAAKHVANSAGDGSRPAKKKKTGKAKGSGAKAVQDEATA